MDITKTNAYPMKTRVPDEEGEPTGRIVGRHWTNGVLNYYIVRWADGSEEQVSHREIQEARQDV